MQIPSAFSEQFLSQNYFLFSGWARLNSKSRGIQNTAKMYHFCLVSHLIRCPGGSVSRPSSIWRLSIQSAGVAREVLKESWI